MPSDSFGLPSGRVGVYSGDFSHAWHFRGSLGFLVRLFLDLIRQLVRQKWAESPVKMIKLKNELKYRNNIESNTCFGLEFLKISTTGLAFPSESGIFGETFPRFNTPISARRSAHTQEECLQIPLVCQVAKSESIQMISRMLDISEGVWDFWWDFFSI